MSGETTEEPAFDVVEAWRRVLRDMPAVGKDNRMSGTGQNAYNFRSIEQFTGHAAGLCAQHGVIVVPIGRTIEYVDVGRTSNGNVIIEARGQWDWRIYGPGGIKDFIDASSFGQGRDSSDKAGNKAATAAFKYLLMPALMISDRKDDPDLERLETSGAQNLAVGHVPGAPVTPEEQEAEDRVKAVIQQAKDLKALDNEGTGPYWKAVVEAAGTPAEDVKVGSARAVTVWIRHDVDAAETLVTDLVRDLKAERERVAGTPEPEKPKRTRAKPGSAVDKAAEQVKDAFPGTEEVPSE